MINVWFHFDASARPLFGGLKKYDFPVPFARVPVVGEILQGPDFMEELIVRKVRWNFPKGFHYPGEPQVLLERVS